ncbi:Metallo-dependent phosphatase-like protein [Tribonema minus]|uniref:Purple acid phosphatase n=1 Tax=Tribonema minus TaxID=303371 RepID=A0A836CKS3_9STRA|nr:Metallo-dependent phosphatase-like protein [Tribonema minus]
MDTATGEADTITVMWHTSAPGSCALRTAATDTLVYYSDSPQQLGALSPSAAAGAAASGGGGGGGGWRRARGKCAQYVGGGGWHHRAALRGLAPGRRYYYRVGSGSGLSDVFSFRMPRTAAAAAAPGDCGSSGGVGIGGGSGGSGGTGATQCEHSEQRVEFEDGAQAMLPAGTHRVLFTADMDVMSSAGRLSARRMGALAQHGALDALVIAGDISYADLAYEGEETPCTLSIDGCARSTASGIGQSYEDTWDAFMAALQPAASAAPLVVAAGNHEADACFAGRCSVDAAAADAAAALRQLANYAAYRHRFAMNGRHSGGYGNMWYSFNLGAVHFAVVCSECNYPGNPSNKEADVNMSYGNFPGDQLAWLDEDLTLANGERHLRPWLVVIAHRPMYTIRSVTPQGMPTNDDAPSGPGSGAARNIQRAFEPILHRHGVNLYLCGHNHGYERTHPVYQGRRMPDGSNSTVYIQSSAAGNLGGLRSDTADQYNTTWLATADYFNYGLSVLTTRGDGSLLWTHHKLEDMSVLDQISLQP